MSNAMVIRIGTIDELTGCGYEILTDKETRSMKLASFVDGKLQSLYAKPAATESSDEETAILAA